MAGAVRRRLHPGESGPLENLPRFRHSARRRLTATQLAGFGSVAALALMFLACWTALALKLAHVAAAAVFLLACAWRVLAVVLSETPASPAAGLPDGDLPTYSVIVPLYREASVVGELLNALEAIDYPRRKLEIIFVVEPDDPETAQALAAAGLPGFARILVNPPGAPKTKPRACNSALSVARGERVVIYDAEDEPDPQQLRVAAAAFAADPRLACVQAPLRVSQPTCFLQRQFALEYACQFEVILPALARLGLPLPLGGTSNHFVTARLREAGGWDAFNVTEDAELGFRLTAHGWRTGVIGAATYETAPHSFPVWLKQRSRWVKGYLQTWFVHMRRGWGWSVPRLGALQLTVGLTAVSAMAHGPLTLLACLAVGLRVLMPWDALLLAAGWLAAVLAMGRGARRAGLRMGVIDALLAAVYWPLQSLAAAIALWQFVAAPHRWEKTPHVPRARPQREPVAAASEATVVAGGAGVQAPRFRSLNSVSGARPPPSRAR